MGLVNAKAGIPGPAWSSGYDASLMRQTRDGDMFAQRYLYARNYLQPLAAVRDEVAMAVPLGKTAKVVVLAVSTESSFVSCGRRAASRHSNMFRNASKVVLSDDRTTFDI